MSKSPNMTLKLERPKTCWNCDNYISGTRCCCKQKSRAAGKTRARREIVDELTQLWEDEYAKVS